MNEHAAVPLPFFSARRNACKLADRVHFCFICILFGDKGSDDLSRDKGAHELFFLLDETGGSEIFVQLTVDHSRLLLLLLI